MISESVVDLSRFQFAMTAMYHFIFVPLTLGLAFILAIMETTYVISGKEIYKDMTKFWGKLFGINFALGVTTGLTMEFQFGTNWAYYSHYVGDIFGAPLAIEGLMAFFANGWMQNPVGSKFNYETMRMELVDFGALIFNPVAQVKFVHTVSAGYVTGAIFVLAISSYYLLKKRDIPFARRSFAIAAIFGLASTLSVILLGDESGYELGDVQKTKLAAIEAEWDTHPAPAPFTLFGIPNKETMTTDYAIKVPYVMGIIATRSTTKEVTGIKDLLVQHENRIRNGMVAYSQLEKLRAGDTSPELKAAFEQSQKDLGYGLLLKKYTPNVVDASEDQIKSAALDTIPHVPSLFWAFRAMVASGFLMLLLFVLATFAVAKRNAENKPWLLKFALLALPLPWVAAQTGWYVAEVGRQPWTIGEVLPTHLSASSLSTGDVWGSIAALAAFYTVLLIIEMYLMIKFSRLGPSSLHTGKYHFEKLEAARNEETQA